MWFYSSSRVLMCRLCQSGVRAMGRHFRREHRLKGRILQAIIAYEQEASPVDPVKAALPPDGSGRIPQLWLTRGFSCADCRYLTANRNNMISHYTVVRHGG